MLFYYRTRLAARLVLISEMYKILPVYSHLGNLVIFIGSIFRLTPKVKTVTLGPQATYTRALTILPISNVNKERLHRV